MSLYNQSVTQQLANAKRDFEPGSPELKEAEQAYRNIGGDPNEVAAASTAPVVPPEVKKVIVQLQADNPETVNSGENLSTDTTLNLVTDLVTKINALPTEEQVAATNLAVQDDPRFEPVKLDDGSTAFAVKEGIDDPMENSPEADAALSEEETE